jgi:hypothetical protein
MLLLAPLVFSVACSPTDDALPLATEAPAPAPTSEDPWSRLLEQKAYPYTTPLPPEDPTVIDGTYSKFDPREGTRPFCRRCMPYPAEGGKWLLQLDKGTYRILSLRSLNGWHSLGSFTVSRQRLHLFNDPNCLEDVGSYEWTLEGGQLSLEVIDDPCALRWRGITFTNYLWELENP